MIYALLIIPVIFALFLMVALVMSLLKNARALDEKEVGEYELELMKRAMREGR
jgi:hypothetical protein